MSVAKKHKLEISSLIDPPQIPLTNQFTSQRNIAKKDTLNNYHILKDLGQGTFGQVKLATHKHSKEKVAIKILEKNKIVDKGDRERVSRELHILKILHHPSIAQLYEVLEDDKRLYLVAEFVSGGELFDYIVSARRVKEMEACKFFQQLIDAVEYLHKLNVVHRDLKPENLLIDSQRNLKVVDFGLSNLYKDGELLKTACGSPCYAAPEMIAGRKYSGLAVDIWSSGVVLFAMVCGHLPFDDDDTQKLYRKILKGDFKLPAFLSDGVKDLLNRLLTVNPKKRITIEEIKKHKWFEFYKGYVGIQKGIIIDYHEIPIDNVVVESVEGFGFDKEVIIQSVKANRHNKVTTLYYLLLKKLVENGHVSMADISSVMFRPKVKGDFAGLVDHLKGIVGDSGDDKEKKDGKVVEEKGKGNKIKAIKNKVKEVKNGLHETIKKRIERDNVDKLNKTTLLPFEENLKNGKKPKRRKRPAKSVIKTYNKSAINPSTKQKDKNDISAYMDFGDDLSINQDDSFHDSHKQINSRRDKKKRPWKKSKDDSIASRKKKEIKTPKKTKPKYAEKLISNRSLKKQGRKSIDIKARKDKKDYSTTRRSKSPVKNKYNTNKVTKRNSVNDKNYNSINNVNPKRRVSYETEISKLNFVEINDYLDFGELSKLKVHRGPINFHAITMRDPNIIVENLRKIAKRLGIVYKKTSLFGLRCEIKETKFTVEINMVEKFPNVFVIKFIKNTSTLEEYFTVCNQFFALMQL